MASEARMLAALDRYLASGEPVRVREGRSQPPPQKRKEPAPSGVPPQTYQPRVVERKRKRAKKGKERVTIAVPGATASGTVPEPPMAVPLYRPTVATAPVPSEGVPGRLLCVLRVVLKISNPLDSNKLCEVHGRRDRPS